MLAAEASMQRGQDSSEQHGFERLESKGDSSSVANIFGRQLDGMLPRPPHSRLRMGLASYRHPLQAVKAPLAKTYM